MRRFLTLVGLLCLAFPAGISISGCVRNPAGNFCNGLGYGLKDNQIASLTLQPQLTGLSLAYGQTTQVLNPEAFTCKGDAVPTPTGTVTWATTNSQLADISPSGYLCGGTWNRNTGGGIADYTYCNYPSPSPSANGLPYGIAYLSATVASVTSNPIPIYVHAPITGVNLVATCLPSSGNCASTTPSTSVPTQCFSQNQQAQLDAMGYYDNNGTQTLLCQPAATATVTAFSVNGGIVTLTAVNSFIPGENVTFSGLKAAAFLNTGTYSVLGAGASSTQFEIADAAAANQGTTPDSGTATTTVANPTCAASIGTPSFASSNPTVASISPETLSNPFSTITALQPGPTTISAQIAQSSSLAGYFSTCPPASINISLANGAKTGVITQGVTQNLTTTVTDTQHNLITGLTLVYESTNPIEATGGAGGSISAVYPGAASIYAVCEAPACNSAPVNEFGLNGTGLPLASNPVSIVVPGSTSSFVWFGAPGQSQYFSSMELITGTSGSTVRLPYVPNSMVMDQLGIDLYFGSDRELMIYSTQTNKISTQDTTVPGVVLAASPLATQLLINDQIRGVLYLYDVSTGTSISFGGMGAAAEWTPDGQTLYVVDSSSLGGNHTDTLYVYNADTGWSTYALPASPLSWSQNAAALTARSLAITIPEVGAYMSGSHTIDRTWCPSGTVGDNGSILFYPQPDADSTALENTPQTDALGATLDGGHILGAALSGTSINLSDIAVAVPASPLCPEDTTADPQTMSPLSTGPSLNGTVALGAATGATTLNATGVNQVITGTAPSTATVTTAAPIAFITYKGATAGNQLPFYLPQADGSGAGPVGYITFSDSSSVTAPLAGTFSPDNSILFVSTAGDNQIHFISIPPNVSTSNPPVDSQQFSPNLPACTPVSAGGNDAGCLYPAAPGANTVVPATVIVAKPRPVT